MREDPVARSITWPIRFRPHEIEAIKKAARKSHKRATEWMRDELIAAATRETQAAQRGE